MGTSDGVNAGHDGSGEQGDAGTEDRDPGLPVVATAGKPSRFGISGRRAQQAARDRVTSGKEAAQRTADAARKAASVVLPRASLARDELRDRIAVNPEVAEQVTVALLGSVMGAAGKHSGKAPHAALKVALAGLGAVGPVVATHTGRQVRRGFEALGKTPPAGTAGAPDLAPPGQPGLSPAELADRLGVRPPPDPEAMYRDGDDVLEPLSPLPRDLALLPWNSLDRRNRFFVLVAAWALREADGIQLLKAGQPEPAGEAFQECLRTAEYLQTPELIARSCEDLVEVSVVCGDEEAAAKWRSAAELARPS